MGLSTVLLTFSKNQFCLCNVSILSFVRGIDRAAPQSRIRNEKKKERKEMNSILFKISKVWRWKSGPELTQY